MLTPEECDQVFDHLTSQKPEDNKVLSPNDFALISTAKMLYGMNEHE
jgi:hypothetical protein